MTSLYHHSRSTSGLALPLAIVYCGLVIYASLYPFVGWQSHGVMPWAFVWAPLPRYWTGFDVVINILGYVPLGFLVVIAWMSWRFTTLTSRALWVAPLFACVLSFCMEALQTYLAPRVSSNVDWGLNTLGGGLGATLAWTADKLGLLQGWSRWREQRFAAGSGFALGLLFLWPLALLYPTPVALGLGYSLARWLGSWASSDNQGVSDKLAFAIQTLGLWIPLLVAYAVTPRWLHRMLILCSVVLAGIGVTTLSNALSFGPEHATAWLHIHSQWSLWLGAGVGALWLLVPRRICWVLAFLMLVLDLTLVSVMAQDPYFPQTLMIWERGQFMRFYGATQWLGWLWPYAALGLVITHVLQRDHA